MNELIKINHDATRQPSVSGRELHRFLEIKERYTQWFTRMVEYGFVENQDFGLVSQRAETNNPKNPWTEITDHAISLDMAKEVCMIQRTDKGKEARLYFIECERKLKESKPTGMALVQEAMQFLIAENTAKDKVIESQQLKIAADAPKVDFANQVGECANGKGIREFGLVFKQNGAGFGQDGLVERLLRDKYIYRDPKGKLRPYAEYTNEDGLFWTKTVIIESAKGNFETIQVKITGKGQQYFLNKYIPLSPEVGGDFPEDYFLENEVA